MLRLIDIITNNYFLKQKLKVTIPKTPVRRLTDNWQGSTKSGKRILSNPVNTKTIQNFKHENGTYKNYCSMTTKNLPKQKI